MKSLTEHKKEPRRARGSVVCQRLIIAPPPDSTLICIIWALLLSCWPAKTGFLLMTPTSVRVTLNEHSGSLSGFSYTSLTSPPRQTRVCLCVCVCAGGDSTGVDPRIDPRIHQEFLCCGYKQLPCDERASFVRYFFFPVRRRRCIRQLS